MYDPYRQEAGYAPRFDEGEDPRPRARDRGYGVNPPKQEGYPPQQPQTPNPNAPKDVRIYNADGTSTVTAGTAAPPPPAQGNGVGSMGADRPIDPSMGGIGKYIAAMMANPDPYGQEIYQRDYAQGVRNIDDSYNQQKVGIDEEMARRGIHDSTIAGGRLHDLNIGRRGAAVELQDRLAQNRARDYMGNALQVGQMGLGWGNQGLQQFGAQNELLMGLLSLLGQGDFVGG